MGFIACIMGAYICKSDEEKSMLAETFSEPGLVRAGTAEAAEHGLGAGVSISSHSRVRPLLRLESSFLRPKIGASTNAGGLCGEEEMPSH